MNLVLSQYSATPLDLLLPITNSDTFWDTSAIKKTAYVDVIKEEVTPDGLVIKLHGKTPGLTQISLKHIDRKEFHNSEETMWVLVLEKGENKIINNNPENVMT